MKDQAVTVKLPADIKSSKVEVIIIPLEKEEKENEENGGLSDLQKILLDAPDMTGEELKRIEAKRKALNEWN